MVATSATARLENGPAVTIANTAADLLAVPVTTMRVGDIGIVLNPPSRYQIAPLESFLTVAAFLPPEPAKLHWAFSSASINGGSFDLYVNSDTGSNANPGTSPSTAVLTIRQALVLAAQAGSYSAAYIHLAGAAVHTDAATIDVAQYASGRPIVFVGAYADAGPGLQTATAGGTTASFPSNVTTAVTLDQYAGSYLEFTGNVTGALAGVRLGVSQNTANGGPGGSSTFAFDRVAPAAPAAGDTFAIVNPTETLSVTTGAALFNLSNATCILGATGVKLLTAGAPVFSVGGGAILNLDQVQLVGGSAGAARNVVEVIAGGLLFMMGLRSVGPTGNGILGGLASATGGGTSVFAGSTAITGGALRATDGGIVRGGFVQRGATTDAGYTLRNQSEGQLSFLDTNMHVFALDSSLLRIDTPAGLQSRVKGTTGVNTYGIEIRRLSEAFFTNTLVDTNVNGLLVDEGSVAHAASADGVIFGLAAQFSTAGHGILIDHASRLIASASTFSSNAGGHGVLCTNGSYAEINSLSVASLNTLSGVSVDVGSAADLAAVVANGNTQDGVVADHHSTIRMATVTSSVNNGAAGMRLKNHSSLSNAGGNTVAGAAAVCVVGGNAGVAWAAVNNTNDLAVGATAQLCQAAA